MKKKKKQKMNNYLGDNLSIYVYYPKFFCFATDSYYAVLLAPHGNLTSYFPFDHLITSFNLKPRLFLLATKIGTDAFVPFPASKS